VLIMSGLQKEDYLFWPLWAQPWVLLTLLSSVPLFAVDRDPCPFPSGAPKLTLEQRFDFALEHSSGKNLDWLMTQIIEAQLKAGKSEAELEGALTKMLGEHKLGIGLGNIWIELGKKKLAGTLESPVLQPTVDGFGLGLRIDLHALPPGAEPYTRWEAYRNTLAWPELSQEIIWKSAVSTPHFVMDSMDIVWAVNSLKNPISSANRNITAAELRLVIRMNGIREKTVFYSAGKIYDWRSMLQHLYQRARARHPKKMAERAIAEIENNWELPPHRNGAGGEICEGDWA